MMQLMTSINIGGKMNEVKIFENAEFSITDYLGASMLPNPALNYSDSIA